MVVRLDLRLHDHDGARFGRTAMETTLAVLVNHNSISDDTDEEQKARMTLLANKRQVCVAKGRLTIQQHQDRRQQQ